MRKKIQARGFITVFRTSAFLFLKNDRAISDVMMLANSAIMLIGQIYSVAAMIGIIMIEEYIRYFNIVEGASGGL
ncbi:MAG: hypothetical protein HQ579_01825 [Candidatus Omnitrophica bacterium]|nr:hypothetical protein [Candidatus Omnitrophota bacterium]